MLTCNSTAAGLVLVNRPGKLFFSVDFTPKEVPSWRGMWVNRAKRLWGVKRKTSIVSCLIKCSHTVHMKVGKGAFTNWLWKGLYCTVVPHKALKARCISAIVSTRMVANTSMRSEERRVGKECRTGWWACQENKKEIIHS